MRKFLITLLIILGIGAAGLAVYVYVAPKFNAENRQIDKWISENNLNKYGDAQNTAYSNGKPVEGVLPVNRYDYIKKTHSDKPWEK